MKNINDYDVVVVGAGIAGLTSTAYLSKYGLKVLLCEKSDKLGGLVNSFDYKGFTFDSGIRAIENSGIVLPMLRQLGIEIEFVSSIVSIGIEDEIIKMASSNSINDYKNILCSKFPRNVLDIENIIGETKKIMKYMDVIYGIDNPMFIDLKKEREYLIKTVLPWLMKYQININKALKYNEPINQFLSKYTNNQSLIDMISQHFFKDTPTFFALSYFSLYLDYSYPKGGTRVLIDKMENFIEKNHGDIMLNTKVCNINISNNYIKTTNGLQINYKKLIWAGDLKTLYSSIDINSIESGKIKKNVIKQKNLVLDKKSGASILTVYVTVDLDKEYFNQISGPHMFYTPVKRGLCNIDLNSLMSSSEDRNSGFINDKKRIQEWLKEYYNLTTYEISCPVIRDNNLAPQGMTGLIVNTLMDYRLIKHIKDTGWYEEFKTLSENYILNILQNTIYPDISSKVIDKFTSTPLTIENTIGNSKGAITGWSFENSTIPVESRFKKINRSIFTPVPDVYQAGQWSFSPSGLPVSILTGKLAADEVAKIRKV